MKQLISILIVLAIAGAGGYWLITNKPEIKKHSKKPVIPVVKVVPFRLQDYRITVHTSGIVEARTKTTLVSEVAGKVSTIKSAFQEGNYFKKNDLLLKIDDIDYRNNIAIAAAEIARQELAVKEQISQSKLAKQDWDLFGEKKRKPSELALRTPHIASAKAALKAAKIRMEQAQLQLARTTITAPYNGRVLTRKVDVGQYVTPGTPLGTLFATDTIEVRLPLSLANYELLGIPEFYQNEAQPAANKLPKVTFYTETTPGTRHEWSGKVVRTSAALDDKTRQLSVIARIDNPFARNNNGSPPVKLGQFLQADIVGKTLHNVALIPDSALSHQNTILLFQPNSDRQVNNHTQHSNSMGKVLVQPVTILHRDAGKVVISGEGMPGNYQLISTPPALATNGMLVKRYRPAEQKQLNKQPAKPTMLQGNTH